MYRNFVALKYNIIKGKNEMQNSSEFTCIIIPVPHGTKGYGGVCCSSPIRININGKQAIIGEIFFKLCYGILDLEKQCLTIQFMPYRLKCP